MEGLYIMLGIAALGGVGFLIAFKIQDAKRRRRH
jgi:hypothetical protein